MRKLTPRGLQFRGGRGFSKNNWAASSHNPLVSILRNLYQAVGSLISQIDQWIFDFSILIRWPIGATPSQNGAQPLIGQQREFPSIA